MSTYRIILWGAGNTAREALKYINGKAEVIGFLDNNQNIKNFEGLSPLKKENIREYKYDFIVICSISYREIYKQLISMAVEESKILVNPVPRAQIYEIYKLTCCAR